MMRRNYEANDSDFASAVAASAHAIHSLGEITPNPKTARANTRKQELQQRDSMRKASMKETRGSPSPSVTPAISFTGDRRYTQPFRQSDSKADAWEKAQIARIRKRYENLHNDIKAWENEKKLGEKHRIERKKGDLELKKSRNMKHYYNKIARIDHVAQGTRARIEEKRKHEESTVKDKAREMRATGKAPVSCFCF